ncbi:MAG: BatA and WFA domain-containing protein [Trueperaceae bacterium]|nr:BatA and WFA domain-containing protein [Trueperaceae bacterium]
MLGFVAPQFLWLLLALPLVVVLHFVRQQKRQQAVSALFLWRQAKQLAQRRRRFSPTWLLILQLLFVSAAAFALSQPTLRLSGAPERILIVDASASMAARDSDGVRLGKAVAAAEGLVDDAGRVAVIRAGLDATLVQPLTDDRQRVRQTLRALVAGDERADLQRAVELANALAPNAEVHLFSDSAAPSGAVATLHPVGTDAQNVGISAFELRNQQAFVSVVSNHPRPQEVTVSISRGGQQLASTSLLIPASGQANTSFPIDGQAGIYRAGLEPPTWDGLALDDAAFAGSRDVRVLQTPLLATLERGLRAIPGLDLQVRQQAPLEAEGFDARVIVGTPPATVPPGRYLFFAPASENPSFDRVADWDRSDPLLRFVDLTSATVGFDPARAPLLEGEWEILARTAGLEPVIVRRTTLESDVVYLRFHPTQTDITRRIAFPILLTNIVAQFRQQEQLALGSPLPADGPVTLNGQSYSGDRASLPGLYTVGGSRYTASLLSADESRLPVAIIADTATRTPALPAADVERQRALGIWLVLLALVVLVGEWWLWSRSPQGWASS